jgi:hypothetical protein
MPAPSITSITFDKPSYTPGQTITATITGTFSEGFTMTGELSDGSEVSAPFTVTDVLTVSDTGSRVWTLVSNNETTAVYTATA